MKNADVQTRMLAAGVNPVAEQPSIESMQRQISSEHERWGKLIKQLDLGSKG